MDIEREDWQRLAEDLERRIKDASFAIEQYQHLLTLAKLKIADFEAKEEKELEEAEKELE